MHVARTSAGSNKLIFVSFFIFQVDGIAREQRTECLIAVW